MIVLFNPATDHEVVSQRVGQSERRVRPGAPPVIGSLKRLATKW